MKLLYLRLFGILFLCTLMELSFAQTGVLDPSDPVVNYSSSNPPSLPNWGQMKKWVRTKRLSWNSDSYKCYIYKDVVFRLKFPKSYQHGVSDGKTYPVLIMLHGRGELGTIYDNEYQLYHGGKYLSDAVDADKFDGFLLFPQNQYGYFGATQYDAMKEILLNYMVPQVKLDPNRIFVNGLSAGGSGTWDFTLRHPSLFAAALPMSAVDASYKNSTNLNILKYVNIWHFQGGLDKAPSPAASEDVGAALLAAGTNYKYTKYPNSGHDCWNNAWKEADFFPYLLRLNKLNPIPLGGKYQFCEGEAVNVTLGLSAGFDGYEWRKDGNVIPGATTNTYHVTSFGVYDCRVKRGTTWSSWSPNPIVVKLKDPTIAPPIEADNGTSRVIPSPASNKVTLGIPEGYTSYTWEKVGNPGVTIGTERSIDVTTPGDYKVKVTEQFGCVSVFSDPFTVIDANGPNKPDAPSNVIASTHSTSQIKVDWNDNPFPHTNETAFEVYQATVSGGPYSLVGVTGQDVTSYIVNNLATNSKYYYIVRAISNTGASLPSSEVSGSTTPDHEAPTAPSNLQFTSIANNTVALKWNSSKDNMGVDKYEIYINGVKSYVTTDTVFTCYNVSPDTSNIFVVKARDLVGNLSAASNLLSMKNGLKYKYYHGTWSVLPDFNTLTPRSTGFYTEPSITPRTQNDNFGFLWEGFITIPVSGTYTFRTRSCDGSKLWLGTYNYSATPLVDNDGDHTAQDRDGTITLTAGVYPISIAFFHNTGSESISVSWKTPMNSSFVTIPNSFYSAGNYPSVPAAPSNLVASAASYNKINLSWNDNSGDETGFEIQRATSPTPATGFYTIATTGADVQSYIDSIGLNPSTAYYYRIRSLNASGASDYTTNYTEANWKFNSTYNDTSGNGRVATPNGGPTFDATTKVEGTHSLYLNGTNNRYVTIANANAFLQEAYTERTIAFWMKSAANIGNRLVAEFGGNDDGLAVMISNNQIGVGIASNNVRTYVGVPFTSTDWNHIAVVYNKNQLRFYLNGVEVASNLDLPYNTMTTTSNGHRIGANNSNNAFNLTSGLTLFNGWIDDLGVYSTALAPQEITSLMNGTFAQSNATTLALPAAPSAPTALTASGASTSSITMNWADNASDESAYELYRSANNSSNYVLIATLPANSTSYTDQGLFANSVHYYKVRAVNNGGYSAYTNEDSAKVFSVNPVLAAIADQYMRYGSQLQINVNATVASTDAITLNVTNLPAFGTFTPTGNGTGTISFNPTQLQQGTYSGITVTATDEHNGTASVSFQLVVNDNYKPVLNAVSNVTVNEKSTAQVNISATDQNAGDALSLSFTGLPPFATVVPNGGSAQINLAPGYADNGTYRVIAKVDDGKNGTDTTSFLITINDVAPANKKIYINFTASTAQFPVGSPWNSTNRLPATNADFPNLTDANGVNSGIGFRITTPWQNQNNGTNTLGATTGNNSGVYPDNVIRTAYFTDATPQSMRFYKLDPNTQYSFTFFGSRGSVNDDRTSVYTVKGTSVSLNAASNVNNTVTIYNVQPDADSSLTVTLSKGASSAFGYLNAMVIETSFNDGTAPAKPRELAAQLANGKIRLTWVDAAYNEAAYEIYRATSLSGPYMLLTPGGNNANLTEYIDSSLSGNTVYYYTVRTINNVGSSPYSDTVSITSPNTSPVLGVIADVKLKTQDVVNVDFTVTDDAGDIVTLETSGLPAFATLTNNGNGTATIHIAPGNTVGIFNVTVLAKDDKGATASRQFKIAVTNKDLTSWYVNFNTTVPVNVSPWNSFNSLPYAGKVLANLKTDSDSTTGVSVTLVDGWESANDLGATTGDNSGIFPDDVMKTVYYESTSNAKRVRITGLSTSNKKYNLIFFASRLGGDNRTTTYSVGGQSVSLNAANNVSNTVQINGLVPDANGTIEFTAQKATGSLFAYLGALVIQSYVDNGIPLAPTNLAVIPTSKSAIQLTWSDKSAGEDGFEVYRSGSYDGAYELVYTTGANATSYLDQSLQANKKYYYKVRAKLSPLFSEYSNIAGTATYTSSVYINFNRTNNAGAPWNNTARVPEQDYIFTNLKSDQNTSTGINMEITKNFSGDNPDGMNTGNNSGIYPDNVLRSSWWVDKGSTAELKISNLNHAMAYTFVFFGSRNGSGDRTSVYTINGKSVSLNASYNINQTVQLDNVRPDENGEVVITISMTEWAMYAYLSAMVIHNYQIAETPAMGDDNATANASAEISGSGLAESGLRALIDEDDMQAAGAIRNVNGYPNPFFDQVTVSAEFATAMKSVNVHIFDISGRVVFKQTYNNIQQGRWRQQINLQGKASLPGVYLMQLIGPDNKKLGLFKLIKNK